MEAYKYDIAISLCKEDVAYARQLVDALNPKLNVFFYEDRQEKLIGELGPEVFGDVFKNHARVVVILYRNEWSNTYYTELERAAILDRTAKPDQGQSFIMVIGMEPGAVPGWYPSSRIYANPMKFSTEKLAEFIEHKVNERGGNVTPLTFEELANQIVKRRKAFKEHIQFLQGADSANEAFEELESFVGLFNDKLAFAIEQELGLQIGRLKFNSDPTKTLQNASSFLQIGKIKLQVDIVFKNSNSRFMHSQMFIVKCTYSMLEDQSAAFERGGVLGRYNFLYTKEYAYNSNQEKVKGWSEFLPIREAEISAGMDVFFGNRQEPYHLKDISSTENLIDLLFVELINIVKSNHHISY